MSIEPMVVTPDIQNHNPKNFDYATLIHWMIDLALMAIKKNPFKIYFKHYSVLMHMILNYGHGKGIWPKELKIRQFDQGGKPLLVQLWTSIWDIRFSKSNYAYFEE